MDLKSLYSVGDNILAPLKNRIKSKLLMVSIVICSLAIAVIGISIYNECREENANQSEYDALKSIVTIKNNEIQANASADALNAESEDIPIQIDFDSIPEREGQNGNDVVGWIYSEGTVIDYPVLQGSDNSYYLNHLYNGKYSKVGSIFMDYRNDPKLTDKNTILYGHHLRSGRMFASLENYKKQDYYDKHKVLYYTNEDGNYKIEVFAGAVVDGNSAAPRTFDSDDEFVNYIADVKSKSTFTSNVEIDRNDRIITLCTCTYDYDNARYMLFGKLVKV